ncbi:LysR family transcriptional regulator [Paraburkholderia rhynchosiae]|uniref:GntR family transcriptional regulator n=1 Tax=Paraburkholderia rhynchosiae TaxID=487049 RepID=A0A2N7W7W1_9BURK|nr:LysR substrate-binding domain-containing protein [Paraburkholderia rhynchosiae]PMS25488.1 GntR family transcriptional regulator [Paraburkholderia rhynchosiae]CAB3733957.1 HTH-type transcriptional regulator CysL [Paraburkholderia rhynchosiae]
MNPNRLDFTTLSLYTLVVKTGSISKAAHFSNLAIGAASKRISDLELALGTALLARHSRGVTATPAGEALYRHAQRILENVDQLTADLSDYAAGIDGVVSLWANTSAITQFLPRDIPAFMTQNPRIRIELEEQNSTDVVMAVLDGRADFGIFADRTPELGLQTITYRWDKLVLVVPNGHPLTARSRINFSEALEYDFVTLSKDTSLYARMRLETEAVGKRLKVHIQVRSFDAMCLMVEAGLGIAVLPQDAVRPHTRSMSITKIEIADGWVRRKLVIGARDFTALPRPARLLLDHLKARSNENMASLSGGNWG